MLNSKYYNFYFLLLISKMIVIGWNEIESGQSSTQACVILETTGWWPEIAIKKKYIRWVTSRFYVLKYMKKILHTWAQGGKEGRKKLVKGRHY